MGGRQLHHDVELALHLLQPRGNQQEFLVRLIDPRARLGIMTSALVVLVLTACAPAGDSQSRLDYQELAQEFPAMRSERLEKIVSCLDRAGFPGVVTLSDGTTQANVPWDQQSAYDQAASTCLLEVCNVCGAPIPIAYWERLYGLEIEAARCLADAGFEVSDPPTLAVYLDTPLESKWSPHREIASVGRFVPSDVAVACPDPADFVTYWG